MNVVVKNGETSDQRSLWNGTVKKINYSIIITYDDFFHLPGFLFLLLGSPALLMHTSFLRRSIGSMTETTSPVRRLVFLADISASASRRPSSSALFNWFLRILSTADKVL